MLLLFSFKESIAAGQTAVRIDSIVPSGDGTFIGTISTQPGVSLIVEVSTNASTWSGLVPIFSSGSTVRFVDEEATSGTRLYRIRVLNTPSSSEVTSPAEPTVALNSVGELANAPLGASRVTVRGYSTPLDGGEGEFYWDSASVELADGGIVFKSNLSPNLGRWKRLQQTPVNVRWFGARGDGQTDDTVRMQAALDHVDRQGGGKVYIPRGVYLLGSTSKSSLTIGDATLVSGDGAATIIRALGNQGLINKNCMDSRGNRGITIKDLKVDCARRGINGILFGGVEDGTINNVEVVDANGYGIWLYRGGDTSAGEGRPTRRTTVSDCHVTGVTDVGIELSGAVGCTIRGNTVTGTRGLAGFYAWNGATDCVFTGNVAEGEGTNHRFYGFSVQPRNADNPAPNPSQTCNIRFVANVARNVMIGFRISGTPDNKPRDILISENSLSGIGPDSYGVEIFNALDVAVRGNHISDFGHAFGVNNISGGAPFDGAFPVYIEQNVVRGGGASLLYGNKGGTFSGNKFTGTLSHSVYLFSWKNCSIANNSFVGIGMGNYATGLVIQSYQGNPTVGNTFTGNRASDDRPFPYTNGTIVFGAGPTQSNTITQNSALGARTGARAFLDVSTGTKNVASGNVDG